MRPADGQGGASPLRASWEVFSSSRVVADAVAALPHGSEISVTVSPTRDLAQSLGVAGQLAAAGFDVTAHLAARMFDDEAHAVRVAGELQDHGVRSALLLAGDAREPRGPFGSALELAASLEGAGVGFARTCFAAYPEGHPHLGAEAGWQDLHEKARLAAAFVTQMCFSAPVIAEWIAGARSRGIATPILLGIPGPVPLDRLRRIMGDLGLRATGSDGGAESGARYAPEPFLADVLDVLRARGLSIAGIHVYTFNELDRAAAWAAASRALTGSL